MADALTIDIVAAVKRGSSGRYHPGPDSGAGFRSLRRCQPTTSSKISSIHRAAAAFLGMTPHALRMAVFRGAVPSSTNSAVGYASAALISSPGFIWRLDMEVAVWPEAAVASRAVRAASMTETPTDRFRGSTGFEAFAFAGVPRVRDSLPQARRECLSHVVVVVHPCDHWRRVPLAPRSPRRGSRRF